MITTTLLKKPRLGGIPAVIPARVKASVVMNPSPAACMLPAAPSVNTLTPKTTGANGAPTLAASTEKHCRNAVSVLLSLNPSITSPGPRPMPAPPATGVGTPPMFS